LLGEIVKQAHFRPTFPEARVEEEEAARPLALLAQRDRSCEKRVKGVPRQEVIRKRAGGVNQAIALGITDQQLEPPVSLARHGPARGVECLPGNREEVDRKSVV